MTLVKQQQDYEKLVSQWIKQHGIKTVSLDSIIGHQRHMKVVCSVRTMEDAQNLKNGIEAMLQEYRTSLRVKTVSASSATDVTVKLRDAYITHMCQAQEVAQFANQYLSEDGRTAMQSLCHYAEQHPNERFSIRRKAGVDCRVQFHGVDGRRNQTYLGDILIIVAPNAEDLSVSRGIRRKTRTDKLSEPIMTIEGYEVYGGAESQFLTEMTEVEYGV